MKRGARAGSTTGSRQGAEAGLVSDPGSTSGVGTPFHLPFPTPLVSGVFLERPNRFLTRVLLDGMKHPVEAHLPDPGRLRELLLTGRRIYAAPVAPLEGGVPEGESRAGDAAMRDADPGLAARSETHLASQDTAGGTPLSTPGGTRRGTPRRTQWTLVLVETPDHAGWVSLDTTIPNRLLRQVLASGELTELTGWVLDRAEATIKDSRFDFLLRPVDERDGPASRMILEAKSVTLVEEGRGRFPDAVTARGARHVREMTALTREGMPAAVIFLVQREDVTSVEAAWEIDPDFSDALEAAHAAGVQVLARRCRVNPEGVTLLPDPVPVQFAPPRPPREKPATLRPDPELDL